MTQRRETCKQCDKPLRLPQGRGRPRVYCSPACRDLAYEERKGLTPAAELARSRGRPPAMVDAVDEQCVRTAYGDVQTCIDQILDSPQAAQDFMDQFLCRTAIG